jgi:hypothetical protein
LALLGDIAIAAFPLVHPHIAEIMPIVIEQILTDPSDTQVSVCNNATWAVGEIALQFAQDGESGKNLLFPYPKSTHLALLWLQPRNSSLSWLLSWTDSYPSCATRAAPAA